MDGIDGYDNGIAYQSADGDFNLILDAVPFSESKKDEVRLYALIQKAIQENEVDCVPCSL